jgi:hypothetical protein
MIPNHHLPLWLHRICNGVLGIILFLGLGSIWFSEPEGSWRYIVSRFLIWTSIPAGIILPCVAHRFSIVQGVAGRDGYEELSDKKPSD